MTRSTQVVVRLTPEMHQQLRDVAERDERTVSQVVRLAVRRFLASDGGTP